MTDLDLVLAVFGTLYGLVYGVVTCRNLDWSLWPRQPERVPDHLLHLRRTPQDNRHAQRVRDPCRLPLPARSQPVRLPRPRRGRLDQSGRRRQDACEQHHNGCEERRKEADHDRTRTAHKADGNAANR